MSDTVLHGTWLPASQRLFLWGETVEPARRKGRQPKIPRHPYQIAAETVAERLEHLGIKLPKLAEQTLTLWLPSVSNTPLPSPELLEMGVTAPDVAAVELASWQVSGLLLPIDAALDLLLALSAAQAMGADLQAWRVAALLAMHLLARQQVVPILQRDGFHLRARWQPRLDPDSGQQLALLARNLPPICRAVVDDPAQAPAPRALLDDFLAAAVDATLRGLSHKPKLAATTPGGTWLRALLGSDPQAERPRSG